MINSMFNLKDKRIAVFGLGVSGLSALRFLNLLGAQIIVINEGEPSSWAKNPGALEFVDISNCFGENDQRLALAMENIELVILSPGIPRDHRILSLVNKKNLPIWGELELAYRYLEDKKALSPIIGITGTNGKTTTTTFLGEMIKEDKKSAFIGGNIGIPFCDYAWDIYHGKPLVDFIVLELSSFQLESIDHFHVNIALFLNLYQNHGERYSSIEDYGRSKFNITNKFTESDILIYPENFSFIKNWAVNELGKKIGIDTDHPQINFDLSKFKLPGIHNLVNLNFIIKTAQAINLSSDAIQRCIDTFAGVHHRIEFVDGVKGLKMKAYNDAKSTNWDATLTAVKAMEDLKGPLFLIIGGKKRGHGDSIAPYLEFLRGRVHFVYLIGEMACEIEEEVRGVLDFKNVATLEETVKDLRINYKDVEGVLLFSPGFPSFDQFKNYVHRGEHFMKLLTTLS